MSPREFCPECQSPIDPDAMEGLCPQCLMKAAADISSRTVQDTEVTSIPESQEAESLSPSSNLPSSDSIPGYEIISQIHRGGQGVVYKAIQKTTRRQVAIKVMREGPFAGPHDQSRFEREVRILAALRHPHIVSVHDSGMASGNFYFTMDYIPGESLERYVRKHNLSLKEILRLFAKVCEAVNAAHLRGIIHRDLKPANILVDHDGEPHILDFGLARMPMDLMTVESQPQMMTRTGEFLGSPPWASPEQADGHPNLIDLRTDVYALGVILFQILTGHFPYDITGNILDILDHIRKIEPAKPSSFRHDIDDEVETIIFKCLAKDKVRRYQTAGELGGEIHRYLAGEPIEAKRDSTLYVLKKTLRRHRLSVGVAIAFIVVIALSSIISLTFGYQARQNFLAAEQGRKAAEEARELADTKTHEAEASAREARRQLYSRQMALAQQAMITNPSTLKKLLEQCPPEFRGWEWFRLEKLADQSYMTIVASNWDAYTAVFSLDGAWLVSSCEDLQVWDAHTGRLVHNRNKPAEYKSTSAALNNEGNLIVFCGCGSTGPLEVWNLITWQPLWALTVDPLPVCAQFSTDDNRIAVGTFLGDISIRDAFSGDELQVLRGHRDRITSLAYSANGLLLASCSFDGTLRIWDAVTGALLRVITLEGMHLFGLAFSPDSKRLAVASNDSTVQIWNPLSGERILVLTGHTSRVHSVAFSPDGLHLCSGGRDGTLRLWDVATGDEISILRGHNHSVLSVAFSPDGESIVSTSRDNTVKLWNGTSVGEERLIKSPKGPIYELTYSSSGEWLLLRLPDSILALDAKSGQIAPEQTFQGLPRDYTPDFKRKIVCNENEAPFVCDAITGEVLVRLPSSSHQAWTACFNPDGTCIATATTDGFIEIWGAATGNLLQSIKAHNDGSLTTFAYSPDGKKLATGGFDALLHLWDLATAQEIIPPIDHPNWIMGVAFSPDGHRIVTVGIDVRVWDAETGELLAVFGEDKVVSYIGVAFSPDGRSIAASYSINGQDPEAIKIWDAADSNDYTSDATESTPGSNSPFAIL